MPSVLVPLAQGCEELEAVTIVDLLRRAKIEVVTASLDGQTIKASRGVMLVADTDLDTALQRDYDMMVLPGGLEGTNNLNQDSRIHQRLKEMHSKGLYTAAICAAPKVLAEVGLLTGKSATGYPGVLENMTVSNMNLIDTPVVTDDKVVTSRGPGTAMDFTLTLIEMLLDKATRNEVEAGLVRG